MSSILKALKKLENEAPEKSQTRFWHQTMHTGKVIDRNGPGRFDPKKKFLLIFTVSVVAFVIGLTLIFKMRPNAPVVGTQIKSPYNNSLNFSKKRGVEAHPDSGSLIPGKDSMKIEKTKNMKPKQALFTKNNGRRNPVSVKNTKTGSVKTLGGSDKTISTPKSVPQHTPLETYGKKPGQNIKSRWSASIPVKQAGESQLKLQAIAWARDPKSRLAVINGRVIREGESVDRVTVLHIGKDEVIFKKGMESWRQLFRLK